MPTQADLDDYNRRQALQDHPTGPKPVYWGPDANKYSYDRHVREEQEAQDRRERALLTGEISLGGNPTANASADMEAALTERLGMPAARREKDNVDRLMWEADRPETWGGDGSAWKASKPNPNPLAGFDPAKHFGNEGGFGEGLIHRPGTTPEQAKRDQEVYDEYYGASQPPAVSEEAQRRREIEFSNQQRMKSGLEERLGLPQEPEENSGMFSVSSGDNPLGFIKGAADKRMADQGIVNRERDRQRTLPQDPRTQHQPTSGPALGDMNYDTNDERTRKLSSVLNAPPAPQGFRTDRITEQQGMVGGGNESQRAQAARDEAERDFKRLFEAADPTITKTPRDAMVDKRQAMMESLLGRDGKNAAAREGRRGWRPPSEEVIDQRIEQSLRNKLTGQVDELSNADGRLAGFNAANDRARQQREAEDKAHLLGVRQTIAMQDERKAAGDVRHRDRVTGNVTSKRVMDRRADVRGKREAQEIAIGIFRENRKIEQEKAAEASRKQRMYDEDMRQGGKLGIIRDGFAQGAAERNNKAIMERDNLDRTSREGISEREIEARLEAARITAGGRGDDTDERTRNALSAETGANQAIMNNPMASQTDRDAALQRNVDISGQLKDMNTRDNPQPAPPAGEAGIKFRKTEELKNALLTVEDPRAAATLIRDAVDSGYINEAEAAVMAGRFGEQTGRINELSVRYGGWGGPVEWLYDKFTGNL